MKIKSRDNDGDKLTVAAVLVHVEIIFCMITNITNNSYLMLIKCLYLYFMFYVCAVFYWTFQQFVWLIYIFTKHMADGWCMVGWSMCKLQGNSASECAKLLDVWGATSTTECASGKSATSRQAAVYRLWNSKSTQHCILCYMFRQPAYWQQGVKLSIIHGFVFCTTKQNSR